MGPNLVNSQMGAGIVVLPALAVSVLCCKEQKEAPQASLLKEGLWKGQRIGWRLCG